MNNKFDLIVIGGGHAGVEAAAAGRRMKLDVALITLDKEKIGRMSFCYRWKKRSQKFIKC